MNRSVLALVAAVVVVALAIGALMTESHPVDACFVQIQPPPAPGFTSGPDCAWYARDVTPYTEMRRDGYPWYIVLTSMVAITGAMVLPIWQARNWTPAARRALKYITPGADLAPTLDRVPPP